MGIAVDQVASPLGCRRAVATAEASAATIAWMRHQTTGYDDMTIARIKGERREVRRQLAERSRKLLERYRRGDSFELQKCPLQQALARVA